MVKFNYNICDYTNYEKDILCYNKYPYDSLSKYKYLLYSFKKYTNKEILNIYEDEYYDKNYKNMNYFNKMVICSTLVHKMIDILNSNKIFLKKDIINNNINKLRNCKYIVEAIFRRNSRGIKEVYNCHMQRQKEFGKIPYFINGQDTYIHHSKTNRFVKKLYKLTRKTCLFNYDILKGGYTFSIKEALIERLNDIKKIMTSSNMAISIQEIPLLDLKKIIDQTKFNIYYDLYNKKILYKILDEEQNIIFFTMSTDKHRKFIEKYLKYIETIIDWEYVFKNYEPCYYCGKGQQFVNISYYELYMRNDNLFMERFAIIHYHDCIPENNWVINKNIQNNGYINLYEKVIIKLWKEIKHYNIGFYDYFITPILRKYNCSDLLPKSFIQVVYKYGKNDKKSYYIAMIQLRNYLSNKQNNLFKIVIDCLL